MTSDFQEVQGTEEREAVKGSPIHTLIISIIMMSCLCQPAGVVSTVFAALAIASRRSGDAESMRMHLRVAQMTNIVGLILGVILMGFIVFLTYLEAGW